MNRSGSRNEETATDGLWSFPHSRMRTGNKVTLGWLFGVVGWLVGLVGWVWCGLVWWGWVWLGWFGWVGLGLVLLLYWLLALLLALLCFAWLGLALLCFAWDEECWVGQLPSWLACFHCAALPLLAKAGNMEDWPPQIHQPLSMGVFPSKYHLGLRKYDSWYHFRSSPGMGQNPVPPSEHSIPTKIDLNGGCTYAKTVPLVLTHSLLFQGPPPKKTKRCRSPSPGARPGAGAAAALRRRSASSVTTRCSGPWRKHTPARCASS